MEKLIIPADVPLTAHEAYREHYTALTKDTGRRSSLLPTINSSI